jgi:uncharacterized protein YqjF (DUF2071 family)
MGSKSGGLKGWPRNEKDGGRAMLHLLKRHPFAVKAFFRHSLVLTYAVEPAALEPLLPAGLALDTWRGCGFLAIALVETEGLRPGFMPGATGRDFFLSGYRIFTRLNTGNAGGASSKRGLRILRSDTDSRLMAWAGNRLTHYNYRLCRVAREESDGAIAWRITTPNAEADLEVTARIGDKPAALPAGSPFANEAEARRFAGPLPYTFDYERETHSIIAIHALRQQWNPQPVEVEVRKNTFLEREPFLSARPVLANAFYVSNVPYCWERGRRVA